jgi:hypothetical protein
MAGGETGDRQTMKGIFPISKKEAIHYPLRKQRSLIRLFKAVLIDGDSEHAAGNQWFNTGTRMIFSILNQ